MRREKENFEENAKEDEVKWNLKLKLVYSKNELIKKAKIEIAIIRKKRKKIELRKAKKYSEKKGKIFESVENTLLAKNARNIELENYKFKVKWIKNYISKNIDEYFNYFKKNC